MIFYMIFYPSRSRVHLSVHGTGGVGSSLAGSPSLALAKMATTQKSRWCRLTPSRSAWLQPPTLKLQGPANDTLGLDTAKSRNGTFDC